MSAAREVAPPPSASDWLGDADFSDAYRLRSPRVLTAAEAASLCMVEPPFWVRGLMRLRNLMVRPLGLKTAEPAAGAARIGWFPLLHQSDDRVVMGLDDRHLDFRIVFDAVSAQGETEVTATTLVKTHGALGRGYLTVIMPFHRLIVRRMLERLPG